MQSLRPLKKRESGGKTDVVRRYWKHVYYELICCVAYVPTRDNKSLDLLSLRSCIEKYRTHSALVGPFRNKMGSWQLLHG